MKDASNNKIIKTGVQLPGMMAFYLLLSFCPLTTLAQTDLFDVIGHPVLSYGSTGVWDDAVVWNPAVLKDGDTLRMWYTGQNESIWTATTVGKIGYAWSVDGYTWYKYQGNPVLQGELEWEGDKLYGCAVIKDGDTLKMWYGAAWTRSSTSYDVSPSKKIGYATSLDGISWMKYPDPVMETGSESEWDSDYIVPHTVIKEEDGYKMWFWAGRPGFPTREESLPQIGLATSPDGINWTKHDDPASTEVLYANSDPVFKAGSSSDWDAHRVIDPIVLATDSGYEMWYTGLRGPITNTTPQKIGYATSKDGITWARWPENPILDDSFNWGKGIYGGSVLQFDDTYHFWFACFHTPPSEARPQIGYANSRDIYIPDPDFLNALTSAGVDTSGDGLISREEAAACTRLELDSMGITHMTGLKAFVNLTILRISNNKLSELDIRNNRLLEYLDCSNNQFTELDVSACSSLAFLDCGENSLSNLDIQNPYLFSLACNDNQLTNLDVSKDSLLINLFCSNNKLTDLDVSQNIRLETLHCRGNKLESLDLSGNRNIGTHLFGEYACFCYAPWFKELSYYYDLDIGSMPSLYRVCTWDGFAAKLASDNTEEDANTSDSVYVHVEDSPNVQFTRDCSADFIPPVVLAMDTSGLPDSVIVESSEEGIVYLVQEGTEKELKMIRNVSIDSVKTENKIAVIALEAFGNGTWWIYARDFAGNLSEPDAFSITGVGTRYSIIEDIRIYPNPATQFITIHTYVSDKYKIEISSLNGQLIFNGEMEGTSYNLDLSSFESGVYFITISSKDLVTKKKIVKS